MSIRGFLLPLTLASACGPPRPVEGEDAMGMVRRVIARYDSAWLAKDSATVARRLAADYVYFTSSGGRSDRATTLRFLTDTAYSLRGQERTELDISIVGQVARAASRWRGQGRYRGEPVDDDQTCVQHWRDAAGRWEMFSEQCVNRARPDSGRPVLLTAWGAGRATKGADGESGHPFRPEVAIPIDCVYI